MGRRQINKIIVKLNVFDVFYRFCDTLKTIDLIAYTNEFIDFHGGQKLRTPLIIIVFIVVVCFQTNDPHASVHEFLMNFEPRQAPNFLLQIKQHRSPLLFAWLRKTIIENSNRQEQHQQQWRHLQHRKPQQHSLVLKVSLELLLLLTLCVPTASAQRVWRPLGAARAALGCGNNTDNNNTNNSGDTWSTASLVNAHLCLKSRVGCS